MYFPCRRAILYGMPNAPKAPLTDRDRAVLDIIDARRADLGISQVGLGAQIGVSQSQVSRFFAGIRPMTVTEFLRACDVLGLSAADVMRTVGE